ncbi:hypothetical protein HMPREF9514_00819 [Enterococcus faecalis TX0855]|nr:hypothetical protein HMPREF9514_00819 [Enterococcus faecalis TX0855]
MLFIFSSRKIFNFLKLFLNELFVRTDINIPRIFLKRNYYFAEK